MFHPILYLGTTSSWFMNIISWLLLKINVTSLVAFISVWLYVTSSSLYGFALAYLWSSHSCYFVFPCVSWTLLDIYVTSSRCACLFMSRSKLFQTFELCVSSYFKLLEFGCIPIFHIIPKSLLVYRHQLWAALMMDLGRFSVLLCIAWRQHGGLSNYFYWRLTALRHHAS